MSIDTDFRPARRFIVEVPFLSHLLGVFKLRHALNPYLSFPFTIE